MSEPSSESAAGPTTEPEPQLISERIDITDTDPATSSSLAEDIAKSVADLVSDLLESSAETIADAVQKTAHAVAEAVVSVLDALLGLGGVSEPVKDVLARLGHGVADLASNIAQALGSALGKLLGGAPGPIDDVVGQIGGLVADLASSIARTLGGALETLLGGRAAPAPTGNPLAQQPASHWNFWQTNEPLRKVAATPVATFARAGGRALGGAGSSAAAPEPGPPHDPSAPPVAPQPLVPVAPPGGPSPAGYSTFLSASGSPTGASQHLFVVLVALLVVLVQGGKLSWYRREPHRPHSAMRLAVERPG